MEYEESDIARRLVRAAAAIGKRDIETAKLLVEAAAFINGLREIAEIVEEVEAELMLTTGRA